MAQCGAAAPPAGQFRRPKPQQEQPSGRGGQRAGELRLPGEILAGGPVGRRGNDVGTLSDSARRWLVGGRNTGNNAETQLPLTASPPAAAADPSDAPVPQYLGLCQMMRDPPSLLSSLGFMDSMDEDAVDDDDEDDDKDDYDGDDNDDHFSLCTEAAYEERVLFLHITLVITVRFQFLT